MLYQMSYGVKSVGVHTLKLFQIYKQDCCQDDIRICSHCLFPVVVASLMTVTDLLQVIPTRLIQAVRNKFLRRCCHQLVDSCGLLWTLVDSCGLCSSVD